MIGSRLYKDIYIYHCSPVHLNFQVPVAKFNEFKPRLKSPKNGFFWPPAQILKKINTNLSGTTKIWAAA